MCALHFSNHPSILSLVSLATRFSYWLYQALCEPPNRSVVSRIADKRKSPDPGIRGPGMTTTEDLEVAVHYALPVSGHCAALRAGSR